MKHATLALLLALSLVIGLVGCGRKDTGSNDILGNNNPNSSMNNGTGNSGNGSTNNGTVGGGNGSTNNGTANGGTNSDTNNANNNANTNGTDGEGMLQGRSFQEMLDDGRITDDDGYLENDHHSTH